MGNAFFITFFGKEVEKLWILKNNLNNNAILVEDQSKNERIILGKAIGYGKKIGCVIDLEKAQIEKNYVIFDHDSVKAFQELIKRIDDASIEYARQIIQKGEQELNLKFNDMLLLTLSDHISFMLKRVKQNLNFKAPLEWDVKVIYPEIFKFSENAVEFLREQTKLEIPHSEATYIALHLINVNFSINDMDTTISSTKIIDQVLAIVSDYYQKDLKEDSYSYKRFINHLRYFILRELNHETSNSKNSILKVIEAKYASDFQCAEKIKAFLHNKYHWQIGEDEMLYLTLHLNQLTLVDNKK